MIRRDPAGAAAIGHDLVIIGGGIYGACLTLEAARRGLRPLLLERGDFGGATSWNSHRILHGGLRYLQTLDLPRFRESVSERRWFCRTFPELVRPQECLMPLYGESLRRPGIFRLGLLLNDLLSCDRNVGVDARQRIGRGRMLSAAETRARFPLVDPRGLRGSGLWYDVTMPNSQRVLMEILRWACSLGATALNYVEATGLVRRGPGIGGIEARDVMSGREYAFASSLVCNCSGPWSAALAAAFDKARPRLFRPSLAFNLMLDRPPLSTAALAVAPRGGGAPVYFIYPAFGRLLAGTVHVPWNGEAEHTEPSEEQIQRFLADLNACIPGLDVHRGQVLRVFAGLLPSATRGTAKLAVRPIVWEHAREGGPQGLVSVSGVKFTTARLVAEKTVAILERRLGRRQVTGDAGRPPLAGGIDFDDPGVGPLGPEALAAVRRIARDEAVLTVDDFLFRRTNWGIVERDLNGLRRRVAAALGWKSEGDDGRRACLAAPHVQPHA
jgi:glycerol-3-phosphate dehydrogenase